MSLLKKTGCQAFFYLVVCFIVIGSAHCREYDNSELEKAAVDYVTPQVESDTDSQLSVTALPLDSRLPVKQCQTPLSLSTATPPPFSIQVTVQIRCEDLTGWTQYVHVRIEHLFPVLVSTTMLAKGSVITEQDIKTEYQPKRFRRAAYIEDEKLLVGSRTKRNIREGQPFTDNQICMVCKGDTIIIYAKTRTLTIKTSGEALQDGNIGEQVRVKNLRSGKTLRAKVIDIESVEVNL
ncbi:flagellar basal body P-ring formation chaperone FlgA [Pseudoalteromonas sp. T1lg65]|uniref:flagellar basal body P-ring formation chaperone FlgA n=1 Tax=Pseudoalteromonas sp. T1lg65 TaxID=2077101 RepID=UPI003F7A0313